MRSRSISSFAGVTAAATLLLAAQAVAQDDVIVIEDFEGSQIKPWYDINDSGFGGNSTVSVFTETGVTGNKRGVFLGEVFNIGDTGSPGFVVMEVSSISSGATEATTFPDLSRCQGVRLVARSDVPYDGYSLSFGRQGVNMRGHKASFQVGTTTFQTIDVPFTDFDDYWKQPTGNRMFPCDRTTPQYCPSLNALANVGHVAIWAESAGKLHLEVKSIKAYGCAAGNTDGDTDGDFFTTVVNIFSEEQAVQNEGVATATVSEEDAITAIENKIALPVAGASLLVSLLVLFSVWRMGRKRQGSNDASNTSKDSKPKLEKKPGDELL